ncbi:MAG: HEAT repeat domain-containing protein [Planctomycetota bacterium]|nr:HEAT repeat domain-containing protein [Planctomycetota bacterium]
MRGALLLLCVGAAAHAADDPLEMLRASDWDTRAKGFQMIERMPPGPRVSALRAVLRDVDESLWRSEAASKLGELEVRAAPALPELMAALFDESGRVGGQASQALQRIGPVAWRVVPLVRELDREDPWFTGGQRILKAVGLPDASVPNPLAQEAWYVAGRAAANGERSFQQLVTDLDHEHLYVRYHAVKALLRHGETSIPVFAARLKSESVRSRRAAAKALARLAAKNSAAVAPLITCLEDTDREVQQFAVRGLTVSEAGTEAIARSLPDAQLPVFRAAVVQLEKARPGSTHAVLRKAMAAQDLERAATAAQAIGPLGKSAKPLVPDLLQALFSPSPAVASMARSSLRQLRFNGLRDEVTELVPFLRVLKSEYVVLSSPVAPGGEILRPLSNPTRAELLQALGSDDWLRAGQAAELLGSRNGPAEKVLPALGAALRHRSNYVSFRAAEALVARGGEATPVLIDALRADDIRVSLRAVFTVAELGPRARPAVPALVEFLERHWKHGLAAAAAITAMGPLAEEGVPELTALLDSPRRRLSAMKALQGIGPPAAPALPKLIEIAEGPDDRASIFAMEALVGLHPVGEQEVIRTLIEQCKRPSRAGNAVRALGEYGEHAAPAVPALVALVSNPHPDPMRADGMTGTVITALVQMGEPGHRGLAEFIEDANAQMQFAAMEMVLHQKATSPALTALLERMAEHGKGRARSRARMALARVQKPEELELEALLQWLRHGRANDRTVELLAEQASVDVLLALLDDPVLRWSAARALGRKGDEARPAIEPLARMLAEEKSDKLRIAALHALASIGGKSTQGHVIRAMGKGRFGDRAETAITKKLAQWGDTAALIEALSDPEPRIRVGATRVLVVLGPPPPQLVSQLGALFVQHPDLSELVLAYKVDLAPLVVELLRRDNSSLRSQAERLLVKMGPLGMAEVTVALRDHDPQYRMRLVDTLVKFGEPAHAELLRVVTRDSHRDVRIRVLRHTLLQSPPLFAVLDLALDDKDELVRKAAEDELKKLRASVQDLDLLMERVRDPGKRRYVWQGLGRHGPAGREALRGALQSEDDELRWGAAITLARLAEPNARDLAGALASEQLLTRTQAAHALRAMGPDAAPALPELTAALGDKDRDVRKSVLGALGAMGAAGAPAAEAVVNMDMAGVLAPSFTTLVRISISGEHLKAVLDEGDPYRVRNVWMGVSSAGDAGIPATVGLMRIGNAAQRENAALKLRARGRSAAVPVAELLAADKPEVRAEAAHILGSIGPAAKAAVPALQQALGDTDPAVRKQAAWALGEIGYLASTALPTLEKLKADLEVAAEATAAVDKILGRR